MKALFFLLWNGRRGLGGRVWNGLRGLLLTGRPCLVSRCAWCGPSAPVLDYKPCGWRDIGETSHGMCSECVAIQRARLDRLLADQPSSGLPTPANDFRGASGLPVNVVASLSVPVVPGRLAATVVTGTLALARASALEHPSQCPATAFHFQRGAAL